MLKHRASSKNPEHVGNEIIKVMYKGNQPVGFITYHKKKFYEGAIHFIDVSKEFRSQGYGLKLLNYGVKDLITRGVAKIGLVTPRVIMQLKQFTKKQDLLSLGVLMDLFTLNMW